MATEERLIKASTLLKAIEPDKVTWRFGVPDTLDTMIDFLRIIINEQPAVEVVRCKNCRFRKNDSLCYMISGCGVPVGTGDDFFCFYGERRPDDH